MSAFPASLLARSVVASSAPVQHHRQHHRQQHQQLPPPPFVPPLRSVMPAGKTPSSPPLISLSSSSSSSSLSSSSSSSVVAFAEDSSRKKQRVDSLDGSLAHQPPPPPQQQQQQQQQQPEQLHKRPRVDSSDPTRSPAVSSPGPAAAGVENSLVTKLLDTVHKFREAEREFWRQQQQLEASSKRMGELCTEIEMLAVKLGQPTTAATAPASSSAPGTPNTSTTASSAPSSPEQSHKRSNGALWAPAEDSEVEDVITPIYQQRHQQQPAPPVQAMSSPPPSAQQHQNPNARWPLRLFSPVVTAPLASIVSIVDVFGKSSSSQVLRIRMDIKTKVFKRKPRTVLVHPSFDEPLSNLILSSSLDGQLQFWSNKKRAVVAQHVPNLEAKWIEDVCWVGGGSGFAMAYDWGLDSKDDIAKCKVQLGFACFTSESKLDDFKIKDFPMQRKPHNAAGISSLCSTAFQSQTPDALSCFSGGCDHRVFLWKAKPSMSYTSGEPWETTVESINVPHSAAVQAMQCSANNVLVTGGADKKLFMTDIERRIQTCSTKFSDNVSFLMLNPLDPQLLLITTTGQNNQFTLMDTRTYSTVLKFGWPETRNLSSYTRPSWSRTGNMVACPGGGERAGVQLWDLRYADLSRPAQTLEIGEGTVNHAIFHPRESTLLTTADRSFAFTSFDII